MRVTHWLVGILLIQFAVFVPQTAAKPIVGIQKRQLAPEIKGKDLEGQPQSLEAYKGKYVILHFWATWCPYCRGEVPKLSRIQERYADAVKILAVGLDDDPADVKAFVSEQDVPYTVIADAKSDFSITQRYRVVGLPVTYVLNPDGIIVSIFQGPSNIEAYIEKLVDQVDLSES